MQVKQLTRKLGINQLIKSILRCFNFSVPTYINKKKYIIPIIRGNRPVIEERWMLDILKILLKRYKGPFIDVGANLGQTLLTLKSINPEVQYIGFEPNPSCVFYLNLLLEKNGLYNCNIIPVGIYSKTSILEMSLYDDHETNSGGSVIENYWAYKKYSAKRKLNVPVFSNSDLNLNLKADIYKIDVEGAEYDVILALKRDINKHKPIIICEVLSAYNKDNIVRYEVQCKLVDILNEIGYKIFTIIFDHKKRLKNIKQVLHFEENMDFPDDCNYLLVPEEKLSFFCNDFSVGTTSL